MTEHARERGRACDHVALHLKRAGQFGHGDVRLGLDAPDQKGLVGGQLPAPARAPPVGRLNRPCSVRPLEKLDGATRADPKMPGRVTARMPGPHVPHDARPQIQGITLAHDRSPDHEESSIAASVTPSRFHPQARRSSNEKLRFVVRTFTGDVAADKSYEVPLRRNLTAVTHLESPFSRDGSLTTGPLNQGTAQVYATTTNITCSAMVIDAASEVPNGIALH